MKFARNIVPDSSTQVAHNNTLKGTGTASDPLRVADKLALLNYTPTADDDPYGVIGQLVWDDDYIYVKTSAGWARAALTLIP